MDLLSQAPENAEKTVHALCEMTGQKKPRIYRKRARKDYLRLSGPALRKPKKNRELSRQAKKQEYQNSCDRNIVKGTFRTAKTAYGLARVMARLLETTFCVIGAALLLLNLTKSLFLTLALFSLLPLVDHPSNK